MDVNNRSKEVFDLATHLLQDLIDAEIKEGEWSNCWKERLYALVSNEIENPRSKATYIGTYEKLKSDFDDYSIRDMDITIISALHDRMKKGGKRYRFFETDYDIINCLQNIRDVRNHSLPHSTANEEKDDIFAINVGLLYDLDRLVDVIDGSDNKRKDVNRARRKNLVTKYRPEIKSLRGTLFDDYKETIRDEVIVNHFLAVLNETNVSSRDKFYKDNFFACWRSEDFDLSLAIRIAEAADSAGIMWAAEDLAKYYSGGLPKAKNVTRDYFKAAHYYKKLHDNRWPMQLEDQLSYASLLLNGFSDDINCLEKGQLLFDSCFESAKKKNKEIITESIEGLTFYKIKTNDQVPPAIE